MSVNQKIELNGCWFGKISYKDLNSKQKEIYNFQKIAATLADYGFNCIKLADDWHGADFLAYHRDGTNTLKVQLKARPTIDKKYIGRNIYMAFPLGGFWYLVDHDKLVEKVGQFTNWLNTDSWINNGGYSSMGLSARLLEGLRENKLGPVYCESAEIIASAPTDNQEIP